MKWTHGGWALLVGGLSWLGCIPPPEEEDPKPPPTEAGDWVDTGRLAACSINPSSGAACGALDFFKMDGCDAASVAAIPSEGVYTTHYRYDSSQPFHSSASFRVSQDGSQDHLFRYTPSQKVGGANGFFLAADYTFRNRPMRHAIRACRAEANRVYGCFVYCREGQVTSAGTFEAARAVKPESEAMASGMELTSETFVAQGLPVDVYVAKGHAYVVSVNNSTELGGLSVFDVSDKAHPVLKKVISLQGDSYWNGVWAKDDALYVASANTGVVVFNISNPAEPVLLKSVPQNLPEPASVHTVFVDGNRLYAMAPGPTPKTLIFDVTSATEPVLLGEYAEPGADTDPNVGYPHDALAFEGRLYINHWSAGFIITDVSDPASVKRLGAYTYPWATSHANAVGRYGERLIAFEGGEDWGAHLRVLDVTDGAQPKLIGEYRLDARASIHNMVLKGTKLYIAHYQHGVRVLDVSKPETPKPLAHYNTFRETDPDRGLSFYEGAIGMRVPGDGYVYTVDTSRGLLLFPEVP